MYLINLGLLIFYFLSLAVSFIILYKTWFYRKQTIGKLFFILTISISWWLVCVIVKILSPNLYSKIFWSNMAYLGIAVLSGIWLLFWGYYTKQSSKLSLRKIYLITIIPLVTFSLIVTNSIHHLVWPLIWIDTSTFPRVAYSTRGILFWVCSICFFAFLLKGFWVLFNSCVLKKLIVKENIVLLLSAFSPCLIYFISLFNSGELIEFDPTPIAFAISAIILFQNVFKINSD